MVSKTVADKDKFLAEIMKTGGPMEQALNYLNAQMIFSPAKVVAYSYLVSYVRYLQCTYTQKLALISFSYAELGGGKAGGGGGGGGLREHRYLVPDLG